MSKVDEPQDNARSYDDFGIDPELVAAPRLPEHKPLNLSEQAQVPSFTGNPSSADSAGEDEPFADADEPSGERPETADEHPDTQPDAQQQAAEPETDSVASASATESAVIASDAATVENAVAKFEHTSVDKVRKQRRRNRKGKGKKVLSRAQQRRRQLTVNVTIRVLSTLAVAGVVSASVWALGWMPLPSLVSNAEPVSAVPAPGEQLRVCPGSLQVIGASGAADKVTAIGVPNVVQATENADAVKDMLGGKGAQDPSVFTAPGAVSGNISQLAAAQSLHAAGNGFSGFAATVCMQPVASQWLVAGNITVGHTLVLDVVNPGQSQARVNFVVQNQAGLVKPSIPEMVLDAGSRRQVSLAGIAPGSESLAVKVNATGSEVAAYLHETIVSTLDPIGSDTVGASASAANRQVIAGLYVYERPVDEGAGVARVGTTVRLVNPEDAANEATVTVHGLDGKRVSEQKVPLKANTVIDYPLSSLPSGEYSVTVDAHSPVVASARMAPLQPTEFAWLPSSPVLTDRVQVAIPEGPSPRLAIANFTEQAHTLKIDGKEIILQPGHTHITDASGQVRLENAAGLFAAVNYASGNELGAFPVQPGNFGAEPVTVVR